MKALADESRCGIMSALLEAPSYVEELSERFGLTPATVSFHLKKLEAAGLISKKREQYYAVFFPNRDLLNLPLREFISSNAGEAAKEESRLRAYRLEVIKSFFKRGRLEKLPAQNKKRRIVIEEIAALFEPGCVYPEREVNRVVSRFHDDHCLIRRLMIDEGIMERRNGMYRLREGRSPRPLLKTPPSAAPVPAVAATNTKVKKMNDSDNLSEKEKRALAKRAYKEEKVMMGVLAIRNNETGKVFLRAARNLRGAFNSPRMQLNSGKFLNKALQSDWTRLGADSFTFEVIESAEKNEDPKQIYEDLEVLIELCREKLIKSGTKDFY